MSDLARQLTPELQNVIRHAAANAPRSLQSALGPSEVGLPCRRRLAYRLLDWLDEKPNPDSDPLPSTMGTAYHAWLAEAFERANEAEAHHAE